MTNHIELRDPHLAALIETIPDDLFPGDLLGAAWLEAPRRIALRVVAVLREELSRALR